MTLKTYFASGPGEEIDASKYDWNWNAQAPPAAIGFPPRTPMRDSIFAGINEAHSADTTGDNPWGLVPDELPHMEYSTTPAGEVVRARRQPSRASERISRQSLVTHPSQVPHAHLLLDRKTLTTAYPALTVSGGKGAHIVSPTPKPSTTRTNKRATATTVGLTASALGLTDSFLPDGGTHRTFTPLWWRTWRYLDLDIITTADSRSPSNP